MRFGAKRAQDFAFTRELPMNFRSTRIAALALGAGIVAGSVAAEPTGPAPVAPVAPAPPVAPAAPPVPPDGDAKWGTGERARFPSPILEALDVDDDNVLSADEIAKSADALKTLDKNADGAIAQDEIMPARTKAPQVAADTTAAETKERTAAPEGSRPRFGGGGFGLTRVFDADKNDTISAEEIAKAPEALKALDKDADGKVTREELFASMRGGDGRGRREGGQRGPDGEVRKKAPDA